MEMRLLVALLFGTALAQEVEVHHGRELHHACSCHDGSWIACSFFGNTQCCRCLGTACTCAFYVGFCAIEGRSTCTHYAPSPPPPYVEPPPPPLPAGTSAALDSSASALASATSEVNIGNAPLYWASLPQNPASYNVGIGTKLIFDTPFGPTMVDGFAKRLGQL